MERKRWDFIKNHIVRFSNGRQGIVYYKKYVDEKILYKIWTDYGVLETFDEYGYSVLEEQKGFHIIKLLNPNLAKEVLKEAENRRKKKERAQRKAFLKDQKEKKQREAIYNKERQKLAKKYGVPVEDLGKFIKNKRIEDYYTKQKCIRSICDEMGVHPSSQRAMIMRDKRYLLKMSHDKLKDKLENVKFVVHDHFNAFSVFISERKRFKIFIRDKEQNNFLKEKTLCASLYLDGVFLNTYPICHTSNMSPNAWHKESIDKRINTICSFVENAVI